MNASLRIPRKIYEAIRIDMHKHHDFAAERIGFVSAKLGNKNRGTPLILVTNYFSVSDSDYVNDPYSGARINSSAIRDVLQKCLDTQEGFFHIHMHPHNGRPRLSSMDRKEIPRLISSFKAVAPNAAHGFLLLSYDKCIATIWLPTQPEPITTDRVTIVGYPTEIII